MLMSVSDPDDNELDVNVERDALFLLGGVTDAGQLEKIYAVLPLDCPVALKGKPKQLYKHLLRHLSSEEIEKSEDEGLSIFLKLREHLTEEAKVNRR